MVGNDAVQLLNEALGKHSDSVRINVVAILNDTTGTLVKGAYDDPRTVIGLILGTGCNGAYMEKVDNIIRYCIFKNSVIGPRIFFNLLFATSFPLYRIIRHCRVK